MYKNVLVLPDGTELSFGSGTKNAIKNIKSTEMTNSGDELALGSACSNMIEVSLFTSGGGLPVTAGDEVFLYKVDDTGQRHKVGPFILEKPTYPSANTMKLTGYDRIIKLDKDLTAWLKSLTGWPYDLLTFAKMVCEACGLTLATDSIPNGDYLVREFSKSPVTGRQIMGWIGEICARFVRANADGGIEFGWYTPAKVSIAPTGANYYFQGSLSYENYQVAPIDAVQLRLADSDSGALWPEAAEGANSYIITGNPILTSAVTEDLLPYLQVIKQELQGVTYTPCKVSIPANLNIRAGNTVQITDKNGVTITAYVMTKTQKGQRDTLECTGSPRRDSASSVNNKTDAQKTAELQNYASGAAKSAVNTQTQKEIFDKLTNGGEEQGIYLKDGKLYLNGTYMEIGTIKSSLIDTENLQVRAANITGQLTASQINATGLKVAAANITGTLTAAQIDTTNLKVAAANVTGKLTASQIDATDLKVSAANITGTLTANKIIVNDSDGDQLLYAGDGKVSIGGWDVDGNSIFKTSSSWDAGTFICTGSNGAYSIGGSGSISGWVFGAGGNFGVTKSGNVWASKLYATGGTIGCWNINSGGLWTGSSDGSVAGVSLGARELFTSTGSGWRRVYWNQIHDCVSDWVTNSSSDINVKNSVSPIDDYDTLFDNLKPCRYKYNYGTSDRYHTGFIAQEVVEAVESAGLTTQDFAGVVHLEAPNEYGSEWLLRRDEFVALNTWQIQKLKERVAALEAQLGMRAASVT